MTRREKNQLPGLPHDGWVYTWSRLTGIIAMVNTCGCIIITIMSTSSINQIALTSTEFFRLLFLLFRVLSRLLFLSCLNTQFVIRTHTNFSVQQSTRNNKSIRHSHSAYEKSRRIHNCFLLQVTSNRLQQRPSMRQAIALSGICQNFLKVKYQAWTAIAHSVKRLATGWRVRRIPVGGEIFCTRQTGPGAHPASYTMGNGSFQGVKRPGRGVNHPPPP